MAARYAPRNATITLPHHYTPRAYQLPLLRAFERGAKRLVPVWHRRAGKAKTLLNMTIQAAATRRVGTYFYTYPTYTQAKLAIWDGMDRDGFPFMSHFPPEIVKNKNEAELQVTLVNGSIVKLIGTDNINSLMSSNPVGVVFDEYALQDPAGWNYIRPILLENGGWAVFAFTPRGRNHGYEIYDLARRRVASGDPDWFCEILSVNDTNVVSSTAIDNERREGMDEDLIQQEYFCSFEGAQQGNYYGKEMNLAEASGRICNVPYDPSVRVDTWWDIGMRDAMSIVFTQTVGRAIHVIDYYEESGTGLPSCARMLDERGYLYGTHNAPHDIKVREVGTDKTRLETAERLGIGFDIVPDLPRQDGIDATRAFLARCYFDRVKTDRFRLALMSYHKTWDERRKMFSPAPYHDWSSNGADAMRYLAVGHRFSAEKRTEAVLPSGWQHVTPGNPTGWMAL